mmetsp:Transcript_26359/g.39934  ORF Transcript_26359/g.39934 Transcript_26359/m.39934 type:complete len:259 (-) Transcript_26359:994-1770(-)|eukprot:CAMPEP_0178925968 /NCGR_PEP_ID=MMETSP0786-20121207/18237_1 /TAXON_ID=186022 /ORGANISM="Thalassionema frauenfeldii, Strain CCMP 1798" /LENGTH=258 /DNA_ID=CAMNT_0020600969 /DNA_START=1 /DNA_END=777 /DNA_ORIENTATION=+
MQLLSILLLPAVILAGTPIRNISVTLRGKKFDVEEATTVQDVLGHIKNAAGVDGRLLFSGQQLAEADSLEDLGVKEGDSLQMVPKTPKTSTTKKKKTKSTSSKIDTGKPASSPNGNGGKPGGMPDMSEMFKNSGGMPSMEDSMDMMSNMMDSPMFQEYMSDPEKLEASRQMILNNPMMKNMMGNMPGMKEILEDKDAFREAMTAAANMYKNMDPETLKEAMMGGGMGMPNAGDMSGLFGGTSNDETQSALEELSEGED